MGELMEVGLGGPVQFALGFGGIAHEGLDFGWAEEFRVDDDVVLIVKSEGGEACFEEIANGVLLACGEDVVIAVVLLEHAPHCFDVFGGVTPIA